MKVLATSLLLLAGLHTTIQVEGLTVDVESHLPHLNTHRYPNKTHEEARKRTMEYITERFKEYGLRLDRQRVLAFASPRPATPSTCPNDPAFGACPSYVEGGNVIGVSGPEREEEGAVVVVGAAYDTTGVGSPLYDNGVGVGVLLEVARLYQSTAPQTRLSTLFVAFDLSVDRYYMTNENEDDDEEGNQVDGSDGSNRYEEGGKGSGATGGEARVMGGGGLSGGWSLVQDYLWDYLQYNASSFGGAIVLGPLMKVNHRNHSQEFDAHLQELFPAAYKQVVAGGYKGDFVAMVTRGDEGDEAALNLAWQVKDSYEEVGGRLVEFSLGNRSHTLLPPALPPRQSAYFWGATQLGRPVPLPAVVLTDTEEYRHWPQDTPAPSTRLTEEQRTFLHTTVNSLTHFLTRRDNHEEATGWQEVGLWVALVATWVLNVYLLLRMRRLTTSNPPEKQRMDDEYSAEALLSKGVKLMPVDFN